MAQGRIVFRKNRKYFVIQRHFSRAVSPPPGRLWHWEAPVMKNSPEVARRMRKYYLRRVRAKNIYASNVPRARKTARLMWPRRHIKKGRVFGPKNKKTADKEWAKSQNLSMMASGFECYQADQALVERAWKDMWRFIRSAVYKLKGGEFDWAASHCPFADVAMARMREMVLGLPENKGWLPGQFGSGAFLVAEFTLANELVGVEYYPTI